MPFKSGKSGNTQGAKVGANKKHKQIRELLMHLSPKAVEVIEECLDDPEQRTWAAKEVLDRVYGKAPQSIELGEESQTAIRAIMQIVAKSK